MEKKVYVKTVYGSKSMREPDISEYDTEKEANSAIQTCLKWGIDIVSCEKISEQEALS